MDTGQKIDRTQAQLVALRDELEQQLSAAMIVVLDEKQRRIHAYLGQARLAHATLLDQQRLQSSPLSKPSLTPTLTPPLATGGDAS